MSLQNLSQPSPQLARLPSQRIGPYTLGKTLGVGSTGRVKLGSHIETNQRVAIKIIPKESLEKDKSDKKASMNKKIEREITIMKLIQHPNVMQLYDVYETEKELFLVLEHIEGGELFDYLVKKGRLSESEGLMFFQQIIYGVEFCHKHLICHRDLKPENLLLDKDLNVKIADFGMASIQTDGRLLETSCGSPHYASPEIIKGIKYDGPAADIWSCGVILYALLTGNLPFDDENIRRLLTKVKSGLYFIPEHVSQEPKDLIKRMLVIEPTKRITMKGVMTHPWFISQEPKNGDKVLPGALDNAKMFEPVQDESLLDVEILSSLTLLGWGEESELVSNLTSEEPNTVKVFYNLLEQRKHSFFENYDSRKTGEWDVVGGARQRTYSQTNLDKGSSRFDLYSSNASLLSSSDFHKRKSVDELSARKESFNQGDKESRSRQSSDGKPEISTQTSLRVKNVAKSPLSAISPSNIEENPQREVDIESGDVPAAIQKLSINTVKEGSKTLPRLGIKPQIDISTVPATPLITNTPKRSWFATLLNFKPETYTLVSVVGLEESMNKMALVLKRSDIRYQMRREGFKCKFENDGTSPMTPIEPSTGNSPTDKNEKGDKSVKFKIDVVAGTDGVRMTFVHQQGAYSIFQSLVEVVRGTFNEAT